MVTIHRGRSSGSPPASAAGGAPSPLSDPARRPAHGSFRHASVLEARHPSHQGLRHRPWQRRTSAPQPRDTSASQLRYASALVDKCRLQASVAHSAPLRAQSRTTHGAAWRAEPLWGQQLSAPPGQAFGVRSVLGTETTEGLGALERVVSRGSTAYAVNPLEAPSRLTLSAPRRGGLPKVGNTSRQPLGGLSQAHPWGHREWGTPRSCGP